MKQTRNHDQPPPTPPAPPAAARASAPPLPLPPAPCIPHSKITLEDLLRLKRAERPAPEFWPAFEQQLKQRQLAAAIHEKRPRWHPLPATLPRLSILFPIGATAALAIGIIAWRDPARQTPAPAATARAPANIAGSEPQQPALMTARPATPGNENNNPTHAETTRPQPLATAPATLATSGLPAAPAPGPTGENPAPAPDSTTPATAPRNPTEAEIAATQPISEERIQMAQTAFALAATTRASNRASNFALAPLAAARPAFPRNISSSTLTTIPVPAGDWPAITINTNTRTDPTTPAGSAPAETTIAKTDDTPANPRFERLLSLMDATATPPQTTDDNPRAMRVRKQAADRLTNKLLTDTASRFGATGDSLSIKF